MGAEQSIGSAMFALPRLLDDDVVLDERERVQASSTTIKPSDSYCSKKKKTEKKKKLMCPSQDVSIFFFRLTRKKE
jgi:hypothetical protein